MICLLVVYFVYFHADAFRPQIFEYKNILIKIIFKCDK